jgi:hypothetical protein
MPRVKKYFEVMVARFLTGTFERIEAVLAPTEDRAEFVRAAVERELKRRKATDPLARHLAPPTARELAARRKDDAA